MDDDKQWITYWVVFALFGLLDDWYEVLLWWLPFYYPIKLMVLTALFWPKRRGAEKLYDKTIRKIYIRYEETIDKAFESFMTKT